MSYEDAMNNYTSAAKIDAELELNWDYNGSKVIKRLTSEEREKIEAMLNEAYMTKEEWMDIVKDSGDRTQLESGSRKECIEMNKDEESIKMNDPKSCGLSIKFEEVYYCDYFSNLEKCPVCNNGQCLKAIDERYNSNDSGDIDILQDSGNRTQFESGAVRDMHEGKGRFDLLPMCVLLRLAKHYEAGAKKYSDRNWEKGIPAHSFADSAMRHFVKYMDGWNDEDHLIAAIWNLCGLAWTEEKHPELIDIPARMETMKNE